MESRVIRRKLKSAKLKQYAAAACILINVCFHYRVKAKDKAEVVWPSYEELIKTTDDCKVPYIIIRQISY